MAEDPDLAPDPLPPVDSLIPCRHVTGKLRTSGSPINVHKTFVQLVLALHVLQFFSSTLQAQTKAVHFRPSPFFIGRQSHLNAISLTHASDNRLLEARRRRRRRLLLLSVRTAVWIVPLHRRPLRRRRRHVPWVATRIELLLLHRRWRRWNSTGSARSSSECICTSQKARWWWRRDAVAPLSARRSRYRCRRCHARHAIPLSAHHHRRWGLWRISHSHHARRSGRSTVEHTTGIGTSR